MSAQALRAVTRSHAFDEARAQSIRRQLDRFRTEIRPAAAALARRHPRLADLAVSFPALLAALAWPNGRFDARAAIAAVIAGAPLDAVAAAARLPLWLRRLGPEMIVAPVPDMPDGEAVRRRIVNHLPSHPAYAAQWFNAVSMAQRWTGEEFALWCAREYAKRLAPKPKRRNRARGPSLPYAIERLPLFCLWAWYSNKPHAASRLIHHPWTPDIGLKGAMRGIAEWVTTFGLALDFSGGPVRDTWFKLRHRRGYEFVPLRTAEDLEAEAIAMKNCVRGYGSDLVDDVRRLFSLRKDGERVATLSVGWPGDSPYPDVEQLTLAANAKAPPELWWLAHQWVRAQDVKRMARPDVVWESKPPARAAWDALWKPYWLAKGRVPDWLPLSPSRDALNNL